MYLTRILLDPLRRSTMIAMANPNKFHGAIASAYPNREARVLWRIDSLGEKDYLMILSPQKFDAASITAQFGYEDMPAQVKDYTPLLERITVGSRWGFRLTANPTISVKDTENPAARGKVKAHITDQWEKKWLENRAAKNGFVLHTDEFGVTYSKWISFYKDLKKQKVTLHEVVYEGTLTVEHPEIFKKALINGIGRAKAYGMGLLTVVRLQ